MTAEALTTEQRELRERVAREIDPVAFDYPRPTGGFMSWTRLQNEAFDKADAILALIEGAQGKEGGAVPSNVDTWCAAKLRVAARLYLGLSKQKDGEDFRVVKFTKRETPPFTLIDDNIEAVDASAPSPPQVIPQAGGERTPHTIEVCEEFYGSWCADRMAKSRKNCERNSCPHRPIKAGKATS